jgi:hypothetical protein
LTVSGKDGKIAAVPAVRSSPVPAQCAFYHTLIAA